MHAHEGPSRCPLWRRRGLALCFLAYYAIERGTTGAGQERVWRARGLCGGWCRGPSPGSRVLELVADALQCNRGARSISSELGGSQLPRGFQDSQSGCKGGLRMSQDTNAPCGRRTDVRDGLAAGRLRTWTGAKTGATGRASMPKEAIINKK